MPAPLIQILTDGSPGMTAQALGLAQALAALSGGEVVQNRISASAFAKFLPPALAARWRLFAIDGADTARPQIIICCGIKTRAAALALKKQHRAFAVCIQRPHADARHFDAIVAPRHDYSTAEIRAIEQNPETAIILTLGSVGMVNKKVVAAQQHAARQKFAHIPPPRTGLLVGGDNRAFSLTADYCRSLAAQILRAAPHGGVLATASRRTGAGNQQTLAAAFACDSCFFYDGTGADNPYLDILAAADRLLVTHDSVNMLSEACAAGKPVQIVKLPQRPYRTRAGQKFHRFTDELIAANLARPWDGVFADWQPPALQETARAAKFIWRRYSASLP